MIVAVASLLAPLLLGQANAAALAEAARFNTCLEKIDNDAEDAYEYGLKWLYEGQLPAARQCVAMALIEMGESQHKNALTAEGAGRLEELANAKDGGDLRQRAAYLSQAGNAWLLSGAPEAAVVTFTNALKLNPKEADARKDRARAYIVLKRWEEAAKDLDAAIDLSPGDADTHSMRAETRLEQGRLEDATSDIKEARKLAPKNVAIVATRGRIVEARRIKGLPDDPEL